MRITENGSAVSRIVLGHCATWLETHGAEQLRDAIERISGAHLLITYEQDACPARGGRILIGRPATHREISRYARAQGFPPESPEANDCVILCAVGEDLILSGTNDRSVYYSVFHLLQTHFHVGYYFDGDTYEQQGDLSVPTGQWVERSAFRFRHTVGQWVYNFAALLNGEERRRELEFFARNKINSYRFYTWNSYFRKRVFQKMGVPTEPITADDLARMRVLQETAEYARRLGMETMVYMLPQETSLEFRKVYPDARYFGCEWVKDDDAAPDIVPYLYPDDPLYRRLIRTSVETWIETYGPCRHFSAAPPSEHHIATDIEDFININVNFAKYTYQAIREAVPDARFFFDGWGVRANTPPSIWTMPGVMERFVDALPEEVNFLDLWPNRKESVYTFREPMYRDKNYGPLRRAKYILEPINEFGGDDHLHGCFERHIEAAKEMTDPAVVAHGEGFGNATELCGFSLHFFDLLFSLAWDPRKVDVESFLRDTAMRRYGPHRAQAALPALRCLHRAVYSNLDSSHARYQKRCYLTRVQRRLVPVEESLEVAHALAGFIEGMLAIPGAAEDRPMGRDLFDALRQYITEYFNLHLQRLFEIFLTRAQGKAEDVHRGFRRHADILEELLSCLEEMVAEDENSYVETVVRRYEGRPSDPDVSGADTHITDFRAWMRDLGTTFAGTIPNLVDYPSRDYVELIRGYYHPRIRACVDALDQLLDDRGATPPQAVDDRLERLYQGVEQRWLREGYPVTDACRAPHLPLGRAAQRAWERLASLPLETDLAAQSTLNVSERADVFASYSEDTDLKQERSWTTENPFAKKEEHA